MLLDVLTSIEPHSFHQINMRELTAGLELHLIVQMASVNDQCIQSERSSNAEYKTILPLM